MAKANSQHITNIVGQIQGTVEQAQNVAQIINNAVHTAIQQGQAIGQQTVQHTQTVVANLVQNILAALAGSNNKVLPPEIIAIVQQLGQNQQVLNLIHSLELYQCLVGKGLQIEYAHLAELYYADQLQAAFDNSRPVVRECIEEMGGLNVIHDIVRPYVPAVLNLLDLLNIRDIVHETLITIIGQDLYDQYVLPVLNGKRGLIGDAFSSVGQFIASVAQSAITSLQEKIEEIKQFVTTFIANGMQTAQQITFEAAQNLVNFLQPYKEDLGLLYNQLIDQLSSIYTSLTIPF